MPESQPSPDIFDYPALAADLLRMQPVLGQRLDGVVGGGRGTELLVEVLRFLGLVASAEGRLTPSEMVDRGWHELILCTRTYSEFCQCHFGRMMHHEPGGDEGDNRRQFKETLRLYRAYFGAPPPRFWHEPESPCGACEVAV